MKERIKKLDGLLIKEHQYFGFFLRFAKEHFQPCQKCQEEINKALENATLYLRTEYVNDIQLVRFKNKWTFSLNGFGDAGYSFVPCEHCQADITAIFTEAELIFGNKEYSPLIEFYRKWDVDMHHPLLGVRKEQNSVFVKEQCILCDSTFSADLEYIWQTEPINGRTFYLCYDCGPKQYNEKRRDEGPHTSPVRKK